MNRFKLLLLGKSLIKTILTSKKGMEIKLNTIINDPLPALKEINPTIEEIDYFFKNVVIDVQPSGRRFDYIIL
jgi:hypothetical protein